MKGKIKPFIAGILFTTVLLMGFTVYGEQVAKQISVIFNGITLKVNGSTIKADNFVYNGTTYVPIRAVAEALDKNVNYDSKTGVANITDKTNQSQNQKPPNSDSEGTSRLYPLDVNKSMSADITLNQKNYKAEIKVGQIIRGQEAWNMIKAANSFNSPSDSGYEYILAKIYFKLNSAPDLNTQYSINRYNFTLVSTDGKDYDYCSVVTPEPKFDGKLYQGAYVEGWAAYKVRVNDKTPVLAFGRNINGTGGLWFKAYSDSQSINTNVDNTTNISALTDGYGLKTYLEKNYSTLQTSVGETSFTFSVFENNFNFTAYDYWVQVKYDTSFFLDISYGIKYTSEQKAKVKQELKDFQEKLAKDIIAKMPNKKLYGGYFYSWYKYPNIKVDLQTRQYYSWTNYNDAGTSTNAYELTKPSDFRWWPLIDDSL